MGWRDVQAGVASGDISFKPEEDTFGSFMGGALGGAIKKRDKEREEAIVAEKERKEQEKRTIADTKAQAAQEKKWKNQSLHVMKSLGLQGGANSPDYLDIFTSISSGISQSDVLTGLNTQITDSRRTIGEDGQFTKAAAPVTADKRKFPDVSGDTNEQLDRKILAAASDPELVEFLTSQRDMAGTQATTQATTEAVTATSALYDEAAIMAASPETLVRMRSMAPPERHAAIDSAIAGLPPEEGAQARYSTMSADDLSVALALATDATEVALIKKAITARGAIVADTDLPKVENVRYDNYKAYALAATNAGDTVLAAQITSLGEDMVKTRADATGVKLQTGSDSYITTYVDEEGETQTTTTTLTQTGDHFSPAIGKVVSPVPKSTPLNIEQQGVLYKQYINIKTSTVIPLESKRKDLLSTVTSAERLKDLVTQNPAVLTTVGDLAAGVNRIGVETATLISMFDSKASNSTILSYIDAQAESAQGLKGLAKDVALYEAEILKFAYSFAASGLDQSGQGLSNKDFDAALKIIGVGSTPDTFLKNLHSRVSDSIAATTVVINDFNGSPEVQILSSLSGDLLKSYQRSVEMYAADHGKSDIYAWGSTPYVSGTPEKTPASGTAGAPAGSMLITQAMVNATPGLGKYLGNIVYKENGKLIVWSK